MGKKDGTSLTQKKKIVLPTNTSPAPIASTSTSTIANSLLTATAPLKLKFLTKPLPHAQPINIEERQKHSLIEGARKRPTFIGKIPDADEKEPEIPVEEQFIMRLMVPEDVKQRFRDKVSKRKLTDDIGIVFKDSRRAIFTFENKKYSARLVDLPCIIEAQKTFNSKQLYKVADVCQMLIVESPIDTQQDEHFFTENTMSSNIDQFEWPDGLTPPLKDARNRRFRKRISNKKIEDIEQEVEKLLHDDSLAEEVIIDWEDAVDSETATPAAHLESLPEGMDEFGDADDDDYEAEEFDEADFQEEDMEAIQEYEQVLAEGNTKIPNYEPENNEHDQNDDITRQFAIGMEEFDAEDSIVSNAEESDESETSEDDDSLVEDQEELNQVFERQRTLDTELSNLKARLQKSQNDLIGETNSVMQGRIQNTINILQTDIDQKEAELEGANQKITDITEKIESKFKEAKAKQSQENRSQGEDSDNESD